MEEAINYLANDDNRWKILESYIDHMGTIGPLISSYENFCDKLMPEIIKERSTIYVECPQKNRCDTVSFSTGDGLGCTIIRPQHVDENGKPTDLYPHKATLIRGTYECGVKVDVHHLIEIYSDSKLEGEPIKTTTKIYRNVPLFHFPCMVRSKFCHWNKHKDVDPSNHGGYFIISGHEKCMIELQKMRTNYPVTRVIEYGEDKVSPKKTLAEVRAASEKWRSTSTTFVTATQIGGKERVSINLQVPFITKGTSSIDIPLACILKLLHVEDFESQMKLILPDPTAVDPKVLAVLRFSLREPKSTMTREEIMLWLAAEGTAQCKEKQEAKRKAYVEHIFSSEFFPHLGTSGMSLEKPEETDGGRWGGKMRQFRQTFDPEKIKKECKAKAIYIAMVVVRLIHIHLQLLPEDDRDEYSNKRLDAPGPLLALHFRINFRAFLRQLPQALLKTIERCPSIIDVIKTKSKVITVNMREPFKKGNWSLQPGINTGVVQAVPRLSPYTAQAHMRRIMTALKKEGKIPTPRQLHLSQWGVNCAIETPEGQQCGLILCLSMFAQVGMGVPTSVMLRTLKPTFGSDGLIDFTNFDCKKEDFIVLINGSIVGTTRNPMLLERKLINMRRTQDLPSELRIVWHKKFPMSKYFFINTDGSVAIRPVFVVENMHKIISLIKQTGTITSLWPKLLHHGCIEFIDCEEQESRELLVAVKADDLKKQKPWTHLEVDPTTILGLMAQLIPYSHMNQSPRNMYWSSMGKQAISMPCLSYKNRVDMHMYVMNYMQRSLVATRMDRLLVKRCGDIPTGASVTWAIMCLEGENMEDSIYMKKQALERGLFSMTYYRTFVAETRCRGNEEETFQIPPTTAVGIKGNCDYSKLGPNGIIPIGTEVKEGDVLIGKIARMNDEFDKQGNQITRIHDRSVVMRKLKYGVVDKVIQTCTGFNGHNIVWVTIRQNRMPVVGDKFASRHGQKGTIGRVIDEWDMPFCPFTGMTPDIIMNPHAVPSRMTVANLVESLVAKKNALVGISDDNSATTFGKIDVESASKELMKFGFDAMGKQTLHSGTTGKQIPCQVFMGPCYYQQLKHMSADKVHSRAVGPRAILTRQPTEGRNREGGIRTGEMEKDALIAHGAGFCLRDRLSDNSDATPVVICRTCGRLAEHRHSTQYGKGLHHKPYCRSCRKKPCKGYNCVTIPVPFATILLFRELEAMHIIPRISLVDSHKKLSMNELNEQLHSLVEKQQEVYDQNK